MLDVQFDPFRITYPIIASPIGSFRDECVLAANKAISANTDNLPIAVMMSGGIDSELVAESLFIAGVPFVIVIGRIMTDVGKLIIFNEHDYCYAERWAISHNIDVIYVDLDVFKQNKLLCEYALISNGFSPQYACHMYFMKWCSDNGYFFVAGNGEMDFVMIYNQYYMMDEQREFTLLNFQLKQGIQGVFQFWKQDGRISSAFLQLPTVKRLMDDGVSNILDYKHECFSDVFCFEGRNAQTGFERLQEWDYPLREYLKTINGHLDAKYYTPISCFLYN